MGEIFDMHVDLDAPQVVVYQMGKVASDSITSSLQAHGVRAVQSHFLGVRSMSDMLEKLLSPRCNRFFLQHGLGQLSRNIVVTHHVERARAQNREGGRLKVISLVRDPVDWYWSNFSQNFDGYMNEIPRARGGGAESDGSAEEAKDLGKFHESVLALLSGTKNSIDSPEFVQSLHAESAKESAHVSLLVSHAVNMIRPLRWLDTFMRPVFDIDVYETPFTPNGNSMMYEGPFADLLLIKFESLRDCATVIGDFAGLEEFELERTNVSGDKAQSNTLGEARASFEISDEANARIYAAKYCRHFGYKPKSGTGSEQE